LNTEKLRFLTEAHVDALFEPMGKSVAVKTLRSLYERREDELAKAIAEGDERALAALRRAPKVEGLPANEDVIYLHDHRAHAEFLANVDPDCKYVEAFQYVGLYAPMAGTVALMTNPTKAKPTIVSKWSVLRKVQKAFVYRSAKLKPRVSDTDFVFGEDLDAMLPCLDEVACSPAPSASELIVSAGAFASDATKLVQYLITNSPALLTSTHMVAAHGTGVCIMAILGVVSGTPPEDRMVLQKIVVDSVRDYVLEALPGPFDDVNALCVSFHGLVARGEAVDIPEPFPKLMEQLGGLGKHGSGISLLRWNLFFYIMMQLASLQAHGKLILSDLTLRSISAAFAGTSVSKLKDATDISVVFKAAAPFIALHQFEHGLGFYESVDRWWEIVTKLSIEVGAFNASDLALVSSTRSSLKVKLLSCAAKQLKGYMCNARYSSVRCS
jgi:hypothetical protein